VVATNTFGINGLVSRNDSSGTNFYAFDPQGSTAERVDSSGALVSTDAYNAWGTRTSTGSGDVFGYGAQWGYYTDAETGLILCGHRYYDPARGAVAHPRPDRVRGRGGFVWVLRRESKQ